jgi:squalene-hopene/tetraprenyl-beta-curcumene cyclase
MGQNQSTLNPVDEKINWDSLPNKEARIALTSIIDHWKRGFPDLNHIIRSADRGLMGNLQQEQSGDVFQRLIIADLLIQINKLFPLKLSSYINFETNYFVEKKSSESGWKYFPNFIYEPNDSDSLGQFIQVAIGAGQIELVHQECLIPIQMVFDQATDGIVKTWILSEFDKERVEFEKYFISHWLEGDSRDPEVIANFFYGLFLAFPDKYIEKYDKNLDYINSKQKEDGSFMSTWYVGPYYGTYAVTRLLAAIDMHPTVIAKSIAFIINTQNEDGGWGAVGNQNISTAIALLTLLSISNKFPPPDNCIEKATCKGLNYLINKFNEKSLWGNEEFIKADPNKFQIVITNTLCYSSSDITAAYCCLAILKSMSIETYRNCLDLTNNFMNIDVNNLT